LGDNIFFGNGLGDELNKARINAANGKATIFGYQVKDPERFGIMEIDESENGTRVISVEEKPEHPKSDYAITGLYFYPKGVSNKAKEVKPSKRNELEITSLNNIYLMESKLQASLLGEGYTWFDTGTFESLLDAANMIKTVENNKDSLICSPELIGYKKGWLKEKEFEERATLLQKNSYGKALLEVLNKNKK
jgi:glucose-1-phosphate thymidylyltransferase